MWGAGGGTLAGCMEASALPTVLWLGPVVCVSAKRQTVALELLESERKYVINISLILKIKATFQGSDGKRNAKERRYLSSHWGLQAAGFSGLLARPAPESSRKSEQRSSHTLGGPSLAHVHLLLF